MKVDLKLLADMDVHQKARFIDDFYSKILFSPCGIAYTMQKIDGGEIRPFEARDFEGYAVPDFTAYKENIDAVGYYGNEDSIATSGIYLASQAFRYRTTGEAEALANCKKALKSIRLIYNLSADAGNPGFMCKPYGFQKTGQTSGDQYILCSFGLYQYYLIADEADRENIREMGVNFAEYWIRKDYVLDYFGNYWDMKGDRYSYNAIMTSLNAMAWYYSGDAKFLGEAEKWFKDARWHIDTNVEELRHTFEAQLNDIKSGKKVSKGVFQDNFGHLFKPEEFLFWEGNIHSNFVTIAADLIHSVKPDLFNLDMDGIISRWLSNFHYGVEDYAPYYWYSIDITDNSWRKVGKTELLPKERWPFKEMFMGYMSEIRWGQPLARFMVVAAFAAVYCREGDEKMKIGTGIMNAVDEQRIKWVFDFDGEQLLPELRHMYDILSGEVPPAYLASYWMLRFNKKI